MGKEQPNYMLEGFNIGAKYILDVIKDGGENALLGAQNLLGTINQLDKNTIATHPELSDRIAQIENFLASASPEKRLNKRSIGQGGIKSAAQGSAAQQEDVIQ